MAKKNIVNRNKLRRIRVIYGFVASILLLCMGLFFFDVITAEDTEQIENIANGKYGDHDFAFAITDLHSGSELNEEKVELESGREDMKMCTRVNKFDVEVYTDIDEFEQWGEMRWAMVLQIMCVSLLLVVVVLTVIVLVSFYINLKKGKVFPSKNIKVINRKYRLVSRSL